MIHGNVNNHLEVMVPLIIKDNGGVDHDVMAILDTGYSGTLILPSDMIAALQLPWRSTSFATLADGSAVRMEVHQATIVWDGQLKSILVEALDPTPPLIGMKLVESTQIWIEAIKNGNVQINRIP